MTPTFSHYFLPSRILNYNLDISSLKVLIILSITNITNIPEKHLSCARLQPPPPQHSVQESPLDSFWQPPFRGPPFSDFSGHHSIRPLHHGYRHRVTDSVRAGPPQRQPRVEA